MIRDAEAARIHVFQVVPSVRDICRTRAIPGIVAGDDRVTQYGCSIGIVVDATRAASVMNDRTIDDGKHTAISNRTCVNSGAIARKNAV